MTSYFSLFCILLLGLTLPSAATAAEVRLDGTELIVMGVDDSLGLGAIDVVLEYGSDVSVTSVTALPGFLTIENIKNDLGMTVIAAISTEGKTGDVSVATVLTEGNGTITLSVRQLANAKGDPISYTNPTFTGTIPGGSEAPVETTAQPTSSPSSGVQPGATSGTGTAVMPEKTVDVGETVALTATSTTVSVPLDTDTAESTAIHMIPETPVHEPKPTATPLSPFVLILAIGLVFISFRMINKS